MKLVISILWVFGLGLPWVTPGDTLGLTNPIGVEILFFLQRR